MKPQNAADARRSAACALFETVLGSEVGRESPMSASQTKRNVLCVLLGVAALMLKPYYHGPLAQVVYSYGGNFAASFAVYFLATIAASCVGRGRFAAAASALLIVEAFEVTNGFGVMSNVYDPVDLVANAAGVAVALTVDLASRWRVATRSGPDGSADSGS
jgi:hypothetical protein